MTGRHLDDHDEAFFTEAFVLAAIVHQLLMRHSTHRVIEAGLLDEQLVKELVESNDRMWLIRTQRMGAAREP